MESGKHTAIAVPARDCAIQRFAPGFEEVSLAFGFSSCIGEVVRVPHERVESTQGVAFFARQKQKTIIEITRGTSSDVPAMFVRRRDFARAWHSLKLALLWPCRST